MTTEIDKKRNHYEFTVSGAAASFNMALVNKTVADVDTKGHVNNADIIGKIYVRNAAGLAINKDYTVSVAMWDETKKVDNSDASYDASTDSLMWTAPTGKN